MSTPPSDDLFAFQEALIAEVHKHNKNAPNNVSFILGGIIEKMGLTERYRDYSQRSAAPPKVADLGQAGRS